MPRFRRARSEIISLSIPKPIVIVEEADKLYASLILFTYLAYLFGAAQSLL